MIAFDIDGVCADIMPLVEGHIFKRYQCDISNQTEHGIVVPGCSDAELWDLFNHIVIDHMATIKPFPGLKPATEVVYELTKKPVYFCTARTKQAKMATEHWLAKNTEVPCQVGFAGSKDKARHLEKRGYNTFIEDRLQTANDLSEKGFRVFLVNRSWNRGRLTHPGVVRIDSLYELIPHI